MSQVFQRRIEVFVCEYCDVQITGNGYTNHCPNCLWSKHVDVHPGDRASECGGRMEPVRLETKSGEERIVHKCTICGYEKVNKVSLDDSREVLLKIVQNVNM